MFFLLKMSHIQLNYAFQLFWIIFGKNLLKTSLLSKKSDYRRKKLRNTLKVNISQQFLLWANSLEYFYLMETIFYTINIGEILTKTFLPHKNTHIQLNYDFQLILTIFGENLLKSSPFSQNSDYLKKNHRIYMKVRLSQQFLLWENPEEYFYLFETTPFVETSEIRKILSKTINLP